MYKENLQLSQIYEHAAGSVESIRPNLGWKLLPEEEVSTCIYMHAGTF